MKLFLKAAVITGSCLILVALLWFIPESNIEQPSVANKQEVEHSTQHSTHSEEAMPNDNKDALEQPQNKGGQLLDSVPSPYDDSDDVDRENMIPKYEYVEGIVYYVFYKEYAVHDDPLHEYTEESPRSLTIEKLKEQAKSQLDVK